LIPAIVVSFLIQRYEHCTCITKVLFDCPLNFKIVNSFKDVQYKMCYKDFKYNVYIVALVKLVKLQNCCADFVFNYCTLGLNSLYSGKTEYWSCMLLYSFYYLRAGCYVMLFWRCINSSMKRGFWKVITTRFSVMLCRPCSVLCVSIWCTYL
jgi:hypothetical protein